MPGTRAGLIAGLAMVAIVSQFFRSSVAVIAPELIQELGLSPQALGLAGGMFFLALGVSQVPVGMSFDRIGPRFTLAAVSYVYLGRADGEAGVRGVIVANLALSVAAVYGLRGVYFAAMEEARVPVQHTGGAVGLISVVGYTPDIFFAPIAGRLLDASPGLAGHQHYFLLLAGIAAIGALCSFSLYRRLARARGARGESPRGIA